MTTLVEKPLSWHKNSPLSQKVKERVIQRLQFLLQKAAAVGYSPPKITYSFDLQGTTAGMAYPRLGHLQFNAQLLLENEEDFVKQTVPHELAHLVTSTKCPRATAHGPEWKHFMAVLGAAPRRCHSYDTSGPEARTTIAYRCLCKKYELSETEHRKAQRTGMFCRRCGKSLTLASNLADNTQELRPLTAKTAPNTAVPPLSRELSRALRMQATLGVAIPEPILQDREKLKKWMQDVAVS